MTTSRNLFQGRLEFLIQESSVEDVAEFYDVTPRTVKNWRSGRTQPSNTKRTSVARRGLSAGAPRAIQIRRRGRFVQEGTIANPSQIRAIRSSNIGLQRRRTAEIRRAEEAGDERALRIARASRTRLTDEEAYDLAVRYGDLERYGDSEDDTWELWRGTYEEMAG